jgi:hypothetical protein
VRGLFSEIYIRIRVRAVVIEGLATVSSPKFLSHHRKRCREMNKMEFFLFLKVINFILIGVLFFQFE